MKRQRFHPQGEKQALLVTSVTAYQWQRLSLSAQQRRISDQSAESSLDPCTELLI